MTVSSIVPVNNYAGNGSSDKFDFDFLIENEEELVVTHINSLGLTSTLQCGIDYSISEIGNKNGAYIVFPLASSAYGVLSSDETISLSLSLQIKQESQFENSANLNLSILEKTFDYIVRILQILSRKIDRSVKVNEGGNLTPDSMLDIINDSVQIAIASASQAKSSKESVSEDRESIETQIESFNETYISAKNDIIQLGVTNRSNINLDNLSETGEKHFLNKSQISNCILEAPEGIAGAQNASVTVYEGVKLLIPFGKKSDNSLNNIEYTISEDITISNTEFADASGFFFADNSSNIYLCAAEEYYVCKTQPDASADCLQFWFCRENNYLYKSNKNSTDWNIFQGIPLGNFKADESKNIEKLIPFEVLTLLKYTDKQDIINELTPDYESGISFTQNGYVCPDNGVIDISMHYPGGTIELFVNGKKISHAYSSSNTFYCYIVGQFKVKEGDVITWTASAGLDFASFFPCIKGGN